MAGQVSDNTDEVMGEINMIPFIDVMLVLLIVFIITVPVMKHSVIFRLSKMKSRMPVWETEAWEDSLHVFWTLLQP